MIFQRDRGAAWWNETFRVTLGDTGLGHGVGLGDKWEHGAGTWGEFRGQDDDDDDDGGDDDDDADDDDDDDDDDDADDDDDWGLSRTTKGSKRSKLRGSKRSQSRGSKWPRDHVKPPRKAT